VQSQQKMPRFEVSRKASAARLLGIVLVPNLLLTPH
jgi:hypothetical protein